MKIILLFQFFVVGVFTKTVTHQNVLAEGPACPIADPLIDAGPTPINASFPPLFEIANGSQVTDAIILGLSTLHYTVDLNPILLTAAFDVTLEGTSGNLTYNASGYIDASPISDEVIPSGNFTGSGFGNYSLQGLQVKGRAALFINIIGNKVNVRSLTLEIVNFNSLSVDFGPNWIIGGKPIDWAEFNANIKEGFDREFAEKTEAIVEKYRQAINDIVAEYTLEELLELIGGGGGGGECP